MWRARPRMHPRAGHGRGQSIALLLMLLRQVQRLDRKPPVTLLLMALMYGLHLQKTQHPSRFGHFSLCPDAVLAFWDIKRVVVSAFLHVDDIHLYHNMMSFLWKGYHLEPRMGILRYTLALCVLLLLCHSLVVVVAFALARGFSMSAPLHQCSIGFSGVLFALKVLLNHGSPAFSTVYGFQVPTKYAAWIELVVIHMLVPRASFLGHMCGILAGYLFVLCHVDKVLVDAAAKWMEHAFAAATTQHENPRRQDNPRHAHRDFRGDDEAFARHLQEQEFQTQQVHDRYAAYERQAHPTAPSRVSLSADELRRRRVERFQRE